MRRNYSTLYIAAVFLVFSTFTETATGNGIDSLPLEERLKSHVAFLASDSLEGRGLGTEGKILAKNYIAGQFSSFGLNSVSGDYFQHFRMRLGVAWVPGTNVVGWLKGSDPELESEYIVIGAHYDHIGYEYRNGRRIIYPGADDNASGTAALIEMARYFSQNPESAGRSIIFIAFDAEESGLIGSEKFISESGAFETGQIRAMISLDMVGMYNAYGGLDIKGVGTIYGGAEMALEVAAGFDINLKNTSSDIEFRTDSRPFTDVGIPAFHAFTGTKSPYHKPEDTYDLLDYEGMALVTEYMKAMVTEMSVLPEILPSRRFTAIQKPFALRFNSGLLAHAGSNHNIYRDRFFRANSVFAFSTGMFFQVHAGKNISLQPEVLYDYNGSSSAAGTFRRHSLTVPVNLHYNLINQWGGSIRVFSLAGGYFRYNLAGKNGGTDLDFDNLYPASEWGLNLGMGADIMKVQISFTWRRGLTGIFPDSGGTEEGAGVFHTGSYITIGYKF